MFCKSPLERVTVTLHPVAHDCRGCRCLSNTFQNWIGGGRSVSHAASSKLAVCRHPCRFVAYQPERDTIWTRTKKEANMNLKRRDTLRPSSGHSPGRSGCFLPEDQAEGPRFARMTFSCCLGCYLLEDGHECWTRSSRYARHAAAQPPPRSRRL